MVGGNVKMALANLRMNRWRSLLTMLGIIIGVSSVIVTVSLGEGLKRQVGTQINKLGTDLITVRSGKLITKSADGKITSINPLAALATSTLTEKDATSLAKLPATQAASALSLITNTANNGGREMNNAFVLGSDPDIPTILSEKITYGAFFDQDELDQNYAIVGSAVADQLFGELNPVGKTMSINSNDFIVRGVFSTFPAGTLTTTGTDLNAAIFIPINAGKRITDDKAQIEQILVKTKTGSDINLAEAAVQATLAHNHNGKQDFTVLKQEELLQVTDRVLNVVTGFISGVAAISLIVGGIGIMNIMLVSVSERTREIGIRKAIGASNRQILGQFITEGLLLTMTGGAIGIILSLLLNVLIRITTDFKPVVTIPVIVIAVGVSTAVGLLFCLTPALKAARKDPIEALRNE
jgi:ABC-type antimicrobial peptide transport system permease subunit